MISCDYCGNQKKLMNTLFSPSSPEKTYVFHRHQNLNKGIILYTGLLILVITPLLAMPWIRLESVTTTPGVIMPSTKPVEIRAESSGSLSLLNLEENLFVKLGDTLFSIWRQTERKEIFTLAPTDGYVHNLKKTAHKRIVRKDEVILEIRSEQDLFVQCYLTGEDITSVQPEHIVEFLVQSQRKETKDLFKGKVTNIIPSISAKDQKAIFEIRCSIDSIRQGSNAQVLKVGTTLLTRFRGARRSAFGIILNEVEDYDQNPA